MSGCGDRHLAEALHAVWRELGRLVDLAQAGDKVIRIAGDAGDAGDTDEPCG